MLWDWDFPYGQSYYWTSSFLDELTDDVIDILVGNFPATIPPPRFDILVEQLGGAVAAAGEDATAFGHRAARYNALVGVNWIDPADSERCVGWARKVAEMLRPHSRGGGYVNYVSDEGELEVKGAYRDRYERLVALKTRYDPGNVFRLNQNIEPLKR